MNYIYYLGAFFIIVGVEKQYGEANAFICGGILAILYIVTVSFFSYLTNKPNE